MKFNNNLIVLVICLLCHYSGSAQKISFNLSTGIGRYQMNDLKQLTNRIKENLPFKTEIVSNFPIYSNSGGALVVELKKINIGFAYNLQSTGNHLAQGDYSGSYSMKMNVKSHSPALRMEFVQKQENFQIGLYTLLGLHVSTLNISDRLTVYEEELLKEDYKFRSRDVYFEPGIKASYNWKILDFSMSGGYHVQPTHQVLTSIEDSNIELKNPKSGNDIGLDWSGYRLLASISIKLNNN